MTNKFGGSGDTGALNLNDGTVEIFASTLGAAALTPSTALKTGPTGLLVSTDLDVTDVTGLQTDLDGKLNLSGGTLTGAVTAVDNLKYVTEVEMEHQDAHTTPGANSSFMYVKTDNKLYLKDSAGNEVEVGGGGAFLPLAGGSLTGDLSLEESSVLLETNGTQFVEVDHNSTGASLGKTQLQYDTLEMTSSDATGNVVGRVVMDDGGLTTDVSGATMTHEYTVANVPKAQINDDGLLVEDGSLGLEPRATAPTAFTATSVELYSNSASSNALTYQENSVQYPIAGVNLITTKTSVRFNGTVAQTLYSDSSMEFIWDASNYQLKFKPKTYTGSFVDATILLVPGNANNAAKDNSGDIQFYNNTQYYFSDDGSIDTTFNMTNYGARAWLAVGPESNLFDPVYRLDLVCGNNAHQTLTIEKQTV